MVELLSRFPPGELIGLVAVGGGLLVALIGVAGDCWVKVRLAALKEEMILRGMSAEEIRSVLDAGRKCCRKSAPVNQS